MSNKTSRVEAATAGVLEQRSRVINPTWEQCLTAALAASDADDLANGIRRVRVDEALVEKAARALHALGSSVGWDEHSEGVRELYREDARAVFAAATGGADG